jgi:hypothetical protein
VPRVSTEPSRDNCRFRLLHGSDTDLLRAVLLLCDRASSAADSAFQRDDSPHQRLDRSAVAGGFPAPVSLPLRRIRPRPQVRWRRSRVSKVGRVQNNRARRHSIEPLTSNLFVVFLVWKRFSHPDGLVNGLYDFFVIRVGQVC